MSDPAIEAAERADEWEQIRERFNQEFYPYPCAACGEPLLNATKTAIYPHDGFICPDCSRKFHEETANG